MNDNCRISVVIPAFNNDSTIKACLQAIRANNFPPSEIIVVNDNSVDNTAATAKRLADHVIQLPKNVGAAEARKAGAQLSKGDIVVFIDADIVIKPDTLRRICRHFINNPNVAAITGRLSCESPSPGFFSHYKNIYMNYVFGRMPRRVNFLSGGFHAIRAPYAQGATAIKRIGEDTALGQQLAQSGLIIELLKDLEAVHLKTYTARTFFRNNFLIPFHWTRVFLTFHGWKQFTSKGRFAHASAAQLLSIPLAHGTMLAFIASYAGAAPFSLVWALTAIWFILNLRFFLFFMHRQSLLFSAFAIPVTFIDHLVMGAGIICGFCIHTRRQDLTHTT